MRLRQLTQVRLWMMLAAFIPAGAASLWLADYLNDMPLAVQPYNETQLQQHLRDDRPVLLFVTGDW